MAVIKLIPTKDTTINSYYDVNKGIDEILEIGVNSSTQNVSRILMAFNLNEINTLKNTHTGSIQQLNLFIATAKTLPSNVTLELFELSNSTWMNGLGNSTFNDRTGVKWSDYISNYDSTKTKLTEKIYDIYDDKDVKLNLTGSVTYSYMINIQNDVALSRGSDTFGLTYFSKDTHTIYSPTMDFKFADDTYINLISGSVISQESFIVSLKNNSTTMYNDAMYRINIGVRNMYPERKFYKDSIFTQKKYLPITSYYSIRDVAKNITIIDFDNLYTKISLDSSGNFFNLYTKNFETNRYYSIDIKVIINGNEHIFKNNYIFKLYDK